MIAILLGMAGWSTIAALVPGWSHTALLVSAGLTSLALLQAWVLDGTLNRRLTMQLSSMIPYTKEIEEEMTARVLNVLVEYGMIQPPESDADEEHERVLSDVMALLDAQGLRDEHGDTVIGRCLVLPRHDEGLALLVATPCPADEYDEQLKRKPSPVRFERNADGAIVLPPRWLLSKIEELADNPMLSEDARNAARIASRTVVIPDGVPVPSPTVAIPACNDDGSTTVMEALPAGLVFTLPRRVLSDF